MVYKGYNSSITIQKSCMKAILKLNYTTRQNKTKVDKQNRKKLNGNWNIGRRNDSRGQEQKETSKCCGNRTQWPLKNRKQEKKQITIVQKKLCPVKI